MSPIISENLEIDLWLICIPKYPIGCPLWLTSSVFGKCTAPSWVETILITFYFVLFRSSFLFQIMVRLKTQIVPLTKLPFSNLLLSNRCIWLSNRQPIHKNFWSCISKTNSAFSNQKCTLRGLNYELYASQCNPGLIPLSLMPIFSANQLIQSRTFDFSSLPG